MRKITFEELPITLCSVLERLESIEGLLLKSSNQAGSMANDVLTIQQAAEFLSISVATIYGYVHDQAIPHSKIRKRLYFSRSELNDWLKTGHRKTIAEINASAEESLTPRRNKK